MTRKLVRDAATFLFACAVGLAWGWVYCFAGYQDIKCDNITMMCSHASVEAAENSISP